ncbi:putative mariner transposase [Trichonephila clavipes]|nr:putative mariner transposase [Trichonephila clavipes]
MRKLCSKWVPRLLTVDQKQQRIDNSEHCLELFKRNKQDILHRNVTMDETCIHYYTPESKKSSAEWTEAGESRPNEANPQVYVETPLHPEKLTIWCALWAGGIIGSYFFKNDEGHNVTVNGYWYRAMITNFFIPELNNHDVQELWFQQDGATCHTARATIDLLKDTFGVRLISRFGPVN